MKVTRLIHVSVEAETEGQAREKAVAWDIIGEEQKDHTTDCTITRVSAES
jgi:hypothetical protein